MPRIWFGRRTLTGVALVIAVLVGLICAGFVVPIELVLQLVAGWVLFLVRVVPQLHVNVAGVIGVVICLAALAFGLQRFLQWWHRQAGHVDEGKPAATRPWRFRWTLSVLAVVVLMFVAGIAAAGLTHQVARLVTSPEPLVEGGLRDTVSRIYSSNHLTDIGRGASDYHEAYQHFPAGGTFDAEGRGLHGWQTALLPYIDQQPLYERIDRKKPWDHPENYAPFRTPVEIYLNWGVQPRADVQGLALSHYAANVHVLGGNAKRTLGSITDGPEHTILAGEAGGHYKPWGYPANWRDPALGLHQTPDGFGGPSGPWTLFVFCDGSIHRIKDDIDPAFLRALSTPNGGEKLPESSPDW
jgi:hypothetical protein